MATDPNDPRFTDQTEESVEVDENGNIVNPDTGNQANPAEGPVVNTGGDDDPTQARNAEFPADDAGTTTDAGEGNTAE